MAKLEIPIVVDIDAVEELFEELKRLQTYKLGAGDGLILVDRDAVVEILTMHLEAKQRKESKTGRWIHERLASTTGGSYPVTRCSACQNSMPFEWEAKYCPNCGAYMGEDT